MSIKVWSSSISCFPLGLFFIPTSLFKQTGTELSSLFLNRIQRIFLSLKPIFLSPSYLFSFWSRVFNSGLTLLFYSSRCPSLSPFKLLGSAFTRPFISVRALQLEIPFWKSSPIHVFLDKFLCFMRFAPALRQSSFPVKRFFLCLSFQINPAFRLSAKQNKPQREGKKKRRSFPDPWDRTERARWSGRRVQYQREVLVLPKIPAFADQ